MAQGTFASGTAALSGYAGCLDRATTWTAPTPFTCRPPSPPPAASAMPVSSARLVGSLVQLHPIRRVMWQSRGWESRGLDKRVKPGAPASNGVRYFPKSPLHHPTHLWDRSGPLGTARDGSGRLGTAVGTDGRTFGRSFLGGYLATRAGGPRLRRVTMDASFLRGHGLGARDDQTPHNIS